MLAVIWEELPDGDVLISSRRARVVWYSDDLVVVFRLKDDLMLAFAEANIPCWWWKSEDECACFLQPRERTIPLSATDNTVLSILDRRRPEVLVRAVLFVVNDPSFCLAKTTVLGLVIRFITCRSVNICICPFQLWTCNNGGCSWIWQVCILRANVDTAKLRRRRSPSLAAVFDKKLISIIIEHIFETRKTQRPNPFPFEKWVCCLFHRIFKGKS